MNIMPQTEQSKLVVRVQANAKHNKLLGLQNGIWQIRVAASPIEGKANKEVIGFLSQLLGVNKTSLRIEKGLTSKIKVITVDGLTASQVLEQLEADQQR